MNLVETAADGVSLIEVSGRIDSTTARELSGRLVPMFEAPRRRVLVDLKGIAYISSAGFRALLIANRATAQKNGGLALCGVSGEVRRLFEIGAFIDEFLICPSQAEGVGKLRQ